MKPLTATALHVHDLLKDISVNVSFDHVESLWLARCIDAQFILEPSSDDWCHYLDGFIFIVNSFQFILIGVAVCVMTIEEKSK